jgi:hypothetical protein
VEAGRQPVPLAYIAWSAWLIVAGVVLLAA